MGSQLVQHTDKLLLYSMLKSFSKLWMFTLNNHIKTSCVSRAGSFKSDDVRFFIALLSIPLPCTHLSLHYCSIFQPLFIGLQSSSTIINVVDPYTIWAKKLYLKLKTWQKLKNLYIKITSQSVPMFKNFRKLYVCKIQRYHDSKQWRGVKNDFSNVPDISYS